MILSTIKITEDEMFNETIYRYVSINSLSPNSIVSRFGVVLYGRLKF